MAHPNPELAGEAGIVDITPAPVIEIAFALPPVYAALPVAPDMVNEISLIDWPILVSAASRFVRVTSTVPVPRTNTA
jgi:hypothetical protein